jgi:hypothetical protein
VKAGKGILRVLCCVVATAATVLGCTLAWASGIPQSFVPVASGKVAGHSWELGMAKAEDGTRCYELSMSGALGKPLSTGSGASTCDPVGPGHVAWRRVIGAGSEGASAELEVTSRRVARLNLFLGHPGPLPGESGPAARAGTWRSVVPRILTVSQASETHLSRNFRFAVVAEKGNFCVEKVRAFDSKGHLLEKLAVPCEY